MDNKKLDLDIKINHLAKNKTGNYELDIKEKIADNQLYIRVKPLEKELFPKNGEKIEILFYLTLPLELTKGILFIKDPCIESILPVEEKKICNLYTLYKISINPHNWLADQSLDITIFNFALIETTGNKNIPVGQFDAFFEYKDRIFQYRFDVLNIEGQYHDLYHAFQVSWRKPTYETGIGTLQEREFALQDQMILYGSPGKFKDQFSLRLKITSENGLAVDKDHTQIIVSLCSNSGGTSLLTYNIRETEDWSVSKKETYLIFSPKTSKVIAKDKTLDITFSNLQVNGIQSGILNLEWKGFDGYYDKKDVLNFEVTELPEPVIHFSNIKNEVSYYSICDFSFNTRFIKENTLKASVSQELQKEVDVFINKNTIRFTPAYSIKPSIDKYFSLTIKAKTLDENDFESKIYLKVDRLPEPYTLNLDESAMYVLNKLFIEKKTLVQFRYTASGLDKVMCLINFGFEVIEIQIPPENDGKLYHNIDIHFKNRPQTSSGSFTIILIGFKDNHKVIESNHYLYHWECGPFHFDYVGINGDRLKGTIDNQYVFRNTSEVYEFIFLNNKKWMARISRTDQLYPNANEIYRVKGTEKNRPDADEVPDAVLIVPFNPDSNPVFQPLQERKSTLFRNEELKFGECLHSPSGSYILKFGRDGNLVVKNYADNSVKWHTNTANREVNRALFQNDGNFVLSNNGKAVWALNHKVHDKDDGYKEINRLFLTDNGVLEARNINNEVIWKSDKTLKN